MVRDKANLYGFEAIRTDEAGRLILVTNRGPIEHSFAPDGSIRAQLGAGGVVSGLLSAADDRPISWISLAMTSADRIVAEEVAGGAIEAPAGMTQLTSRLVSVPKGMYQRYYDGFSNRVLWFAHHGMLRPDTVTAESHLDWTYGYCPVNEAIAQAVIDELDSSGELTPVLFQDYHLYLAPRIVRACRPYACLLHFIHVPWPSASDWSSVPVDYVYAIYRGLVANDVIGFQTQRDADRFLEGAKRFLPGAAILRTPDEIFWRGHRTQVRVYPIAITPGSAHESARSAAAQDQAKEILRDIGVGPERKLILRVDRLEPTKNIVRGFQAYERLLERHSELLQKVTFLALLVPSREGLEEYRNYAEQVREVIDRINRRFGTTDWRPIAAIFGNDRPRALACMQHYDVLIVNPLVDGMNLVVKEGGLLNRRDGAIVLSATAGAYEQLRGGVLGIEPEDIDATEAALYQALTMTARVRAKRANHVRNVLLGEDAGRWLSRQCADLFHYTASRRQQPIAKLMSFPTRKLSAEEDEFYRSARTLPLANRRQFLGNAGISSSFFTMSTDADAQGLGQQ
ncbi:MAG: trehalose-6-phosphate synthase [Ktedonobacterales bacterium]